jgi:hypothetical protein
MLADAGKGEHGRLFRGQIVLKRFHVKRDLGAGSDLARRRFGGALWHEQEGAWSFPAPTFGVELCDDAAVSAEAAFSNSIKQLAAAKSV